MRRVLTSCAAVALSCAGVAGLPAAAQAIPTACDPNSTWTTWSSVSSPWAVTHASRYENYGASTVNWTKSASYEAQLTASISITTGGSVSASIKIAQLDAETSYTLAASGSATKTTSESVSGSIPSHHIAVFFAGNRKTTGYWSTMKCDSRGQTSSRIGSGSAKSYSNYTEGVVDCAASPSSTTLAYVAKRNYC